VSARETRARLRGTWVAVGGGVSGRYVGTSPAGVEWYAYQPEHYPVMCRALDQLWHRAESAGEMPAKQLPACAAERSSTGGES